MKQKIKIGLYWSDYHRQFYHYDGKDVYNFWEYDNPRFRAGYQKSIFSISEFLQFEPTYLGEF